MAESNEDQQFNSAPQGDRHGSEEAKSGHVSVLLKEATDFLDIRRGGTYIDATVGLGGHSEAIARRLGPQGRLIGFDKDTRALQIALGLTLADRKITRLNSSHLTQSRMPSSA